MKLHLTRGDGNQLITAYEAGWIAINQVRYQHSLIVLPELLLPEWPVSDFAQLTTAHFAEIASLAPNGLKPEVLLLGTGASHRFIEPRLSRALTEAGIGIECMSTAAACRTYNFLMAEGRNVTAALIIETAAD